jgi:hypothetical protein
LALDGAAAPIYRKWGESWQQKAQALQQELEAREGSRPRLGNGGQIRPPVVKPVEKPKSLTAEQAIQMAVADLKSGTRR